MGRSELLDFFGGTGAGCTFTLNATSEACSPRELRRRPDDHTAKFMQLLVSENQTSVRLSRFTRPRPDNSQNFAHLLR